jgi:Lon protease-like protein
VLSGPKQPVPVFPLPVAALFPHARVPLHVFELRYRTMVREALSAERLIAMAALRPGWERDYYGSPPFHDIGCLGRIDEVEWLPDDCYNVVLLGLARVHFDRLVREFPYRAARVTVLPEAPYSEDDPLIQVERQALLEAHQRLERAVGTEPASLERLRAARFDELVNGLCAAAPAEAADRLAWLELDSVVERAARLRGWIEARLRHLAGPPAGGERN